MKYFVPPMCLILSMLLGCTTEEMPQAPQEEPREQSTAPAEDASASEGSDVTAKDVRRKVDEATEALEQYSAQKTQEAFDGAKTNLKEMKQKIGDFKSNLGKLQQSAQEEFRESIQGLDQKLQDAEQRLARLRNVGGESLKEAQASLQEALDDIESGYQQAVDAFEKVGTPKETAEADDKPNEPPVPAATPKKPADEPEDQADQENAGNSKES
jgi:ABC-type transporter Mla subunit MlaD